MDSDAAKMGSPASEFYSLTKKNSSQGGEGNPASGSGHSARQVRSQLPFQRLSTSRVVRCVCDYHVCLAPPN